MIFWLIFAPFYLPLRLLHWALWGRYRSAWARADEEASR